MPNCLVIDYNIKNRHFLDAAETAHNMLDILSWIAIPK
jgi:hypothetical protein